MMGREARTARQKAANMGRGPWPQAQRWPRQDGPGGRALLADHGEAEVRPELLRDLNSAAASQAPEEVPLSHQLAVTSSRGARGSWHVDGELTLPQVFPCSLT